MKFKDVEHLFRLAAIFGIGILTFAVARAQLVPEDFGRLGHYRANAVDEMRAKPIVHAGQKACAECHTDVVDTRAPSRHKALSCESCHGPLARHAAGDEAFTFQKPDVQPLCVRCHAAKTGKPERYPRVDIADHAGDETCVSCHQPHDPRVQ
jgi:predicted CXXCH cytochrome family protein